MTKIASVFIFIPLFFTAESATFRKEDSLEHGPALGVYALSNATTSDKNEMA